LNGGGVTIGGFRAAYGAMAQVTKRRLENMFRAAVLIVAATLATGWAAFAESTRQPASAKNPLGTGSDKERVACAQDVVKYCGHELDVNINDTQAILRCLQRNRSQITVECGAVLENHGL
jgi:hypothetical protein